MKEQSSTFNNNQLLLTEALLIFRRFSQKHNHHLLCHNKPTINFHHQAHRIRQSKNHRYSYQSHQAPYFEDAEQYCKNQFL